MADVRLHPHARSRLRLRGATEAEVIETVLTGLSSPAKLGRTLFVREFAFSGIRAGRAYQAKTVEAYAVDEDAWLVITVVVKFRRAPGP